MLPDLAYYLVQQIWIWIWMAPQTRNNIWNKMKEYTDMVHAMVNILPYFRDDNNLVDIWNPLLLLLLYLPYELLESNYCLK